MRAMQADTLSLAAALLPCSTGRPIIRSPPPRSMELAASTPAWPATAPRPLISQAWVRHLAHDLFADGSAPPSGFFEHALARRPYGA